MNEPKITVVIPTRERCDVLASSLQTVVAQDDDRLEVIVSDNFSSDRTREVVNDLRDSRVRYINTGQRVSMSHNWEFALSHVTGGWLTILGDDDGLLPKALKRVRELVRASDAEAVRSKVCSFGWPAPLSGSSGILSVPLGHGAEMRSSEQWLERALRGQAAYTELPMLYNGGFVAYSAIERVRHITGNFYRSSIPDVYSAVAIASVTKRYLFSHEPLAINGASQHSTGTAYFAKQPTGDACSANLFHSEGIIPVHADIPVGSDGRFPRSLQAMVFESYLQSEALRAGSNRGLHALQLELVLSGNPSDDPELVSWGQRFARMHDLDFSVAATRALWTRRKHRLTSVHRHLVDEVNTFECGSSTLPLKNIYDACLVAGFIREFESHHRTWRTVLKSRLAKKFGTAFLERRADA